MINRRLVFAALGLGFALALAPRAALAGNHHVTQAVAETREAIHEGKQHMFSSFAEHTHNALDHAREAVAGGFDPKGHVKMAITHLRQAIKTAKRTHDAKRLAAGVRHAERALIHLKVAAEH
ncbi:small metal-binding protein SmbP [Methylocystis sp. ATCC 49242]|uniref:small metal-binding protein SmbP n=1 Tax=Methylocystis sp. ATCC 49242 TaxID=622637 RepID=UPI0001F8843C|nr:small metal-binding protein SmbP [Methylocystis sp. ATCC 49242]